MSLSVSVVIPSLGREKELIDTVRALLNQTRLPDEIVVVDQNEPAFEAVDRFFAQDARIRHLRATPGYAKNLNRGLKEAQGEIVIFLDDDVEPTSGLIEAHLLNYQKDPELGGVAGRVLQAQGDRDPDLLRKVGQYSIWSGEVLANFNAKFRSPVQLAQGANMSFRRSILLEAGGFDEGFDGNGYRCESDACLRVARAGHSIIFDPQAELKHLMAPAGGCRVPDKSVHTYYFVKNGIRLYRRHSPWVGQPFFATKMTAYVLAKSLYNQNGRILKRGLQAVWEGFYSPLRLTNSIEPS